MYNSGGVDVASAETVDIVSCDELRPFWISWEEGLIKVGQGTDQVMSLCTNYSTYMYKSIDKELAS